MNKVFLIGNTTKEIKLETTNSSISYVRFTIAVPRKYTNQNGEKETDFVNCIAWRNLAETIANYVKKGNKISVVGFLQVRSYDRDDGTKAQVSEVVVEEVEFLSPKQVENGESKESKENAETSPQQQPMKLDPIDDDDLPF